MAAAGAERAGRSEVVLMCGIAGSGKTTYAKALETRGYVRLSIDEEVWRRFGFEPPSGEGEEEPCEPGCHPHCNGGDRAPNRLEC